MPHLVVDISGHGFGHAGQVAPVLLALAARRPDLRLTLRTAVPAAHLEGLLPIPFELQDPPPDIGLVMHGPVVVDVAASRAAYAALHRDWPAVVASEAAALGRLAPDLLLADVGYVGLAAAASAGIPALALCSLNWADIAEALGVATPAAVLAMRTAYRSARIFLQATPHMPMAWLERRQPIGPIGRIGTPRRAALLGALGLPADELLVLVSFGGIPAGDEVAAFPQVPGVTWLADRSVRPGMIPLARLPFSFIDLMASVDLVVTKTGYGMFVEAACNGVPVLFLARPDWPESPWLEGWIVDLGLGRPLPRQSDELARRLRERDLPARRSGIEPTGIAEAADAIEACLR